MLFEFKNTRKRRLPRDKAAEQATKIDPPELLDFLPVNVGKQDADRVDRDRIVSLTQFQPIRQCDGRRLAS